MMDRRVYVLGGGPAALAIADELAQQKVSFTLIEKGSQLGGLAKTITWKNHGRCDLGPHKIFTIDQNLFARIKSLLPKENWIEREKKSTIFMKGKYLAYPPSPFSLVSVYGPVRFLGMCFSYAFALLKSLFHQNFKAETFEQDVVHRVGHQLYRALFQPIALKLWGDPAHLDSKLSQGRVQTPKISEIIGRLLGLQKTSNFEALTFLYPKGGLQTLWESIYQKSMRIGDFQLNSEVTKIEMLGSRVSQIVTTGADGSEKKFNLGPNDYVLSTLPLSLYPRTMSHFPSEMAHKIEKYVHLNDLILVYFKFQIESLFDESWVFVPDPEIVFHRVSEQESFDPSMTPGGTIVCCEIMNNPGRPMGLKSNQELIDLALIGIEKLKNSKIQYLDATVIRLEKSYPVFVPGFEPNLKIVLDYLDQLENFRTVGRQGAFNYIGTLDAMDIGYGAARQVAALAPQTNQLADWVAERERTRHYPVLD